MKIWLSILLVLLFSASANAASIRLGKPGYGGSGCPGGTASATLNTSGTQLSLRFSDYEASAGNGRAFARKTCNLSIPISVPAGKSVSILAIDFRGYNSLPAGANSDFRVEYFFSGSTGKAFKKTFNGPDQGSFQIGQTLTAKSWSACGQDVILRTNSSILVRSAGGKRASTTVDSARVKSAIVYRLQWRDC